MLRSLFYFWAEALRSICRNGWMSIASVSVVSITLLVLGSFMVVNYNVDTIAQDIKEQVEIILYVKEDATEEDILVLQDKLVAHPSMEEVRFVSKKEAMMRLKDQFGDQSDLLDIYDEEEENPLPNSFEIKTKRPEEVAEVAADISQYPHVDYVDYGKDVVEPLFRVTGLIRVVGAGFMVGLAVTATFLIAHTIRLTVVLRSKEIKIMKYVGATDWFIRWPFVFEGFFLGLAGALVPLAVIYFGYTAAVEWLEQNIYFIALISPQDVMPELLKTLLPLGILLGILGGVVSLRRFLKV
ncbi:MAG: ABC transporter permease [Firmicutes bacterium]|nr:ABC transporter permease [Bacillota bacterium]